MADIELQCWRCGAALVDVLLPLPREVLCRACNAPLHVCLLCEFRDPRVAKQCREPIAEEVKDKTRANFCDYFRPRPGAHVAPDADALAGARAGLEALFGGAPATPQAQDPARAGLDALFGTRERDG